MCIMRKYIYHGGDNLLINELHSLNTESSFVLVIEEKKCVALEF